MGVPRNRHWGAGAAAAQVGLGLVQAPCHLFARGLADGTLVEVLGDFPPTPVSVLDPSSHHLSPRVRVFVDWLAATLENGFHSSRFPGRTSVPGRKTGVRS